MQPLTSLAMTKLGIQRLLPTQLILDPPAVTPAIQHRLEIRAVLVHLVRLAELPLVLLALEVLRGRALRAGLGFLGRRGHLEGLGRGDEGSGFGGGVVGEGDVRRGADGAGELEGYGE